MPGNMTDHPSSFPHPMTIIQMHAVHLESDLWRSVMEKFHYSSKTGIETHFLLLHPDIMIMDSLRYVDDEPTLLEIGTIFLERTGEISKISSPAIEIGSVHTSED
jgi:hypothetical protein